MPLLLNLLGAVPKVAGALLSDALGLATRPLVPLSLVLHDWPTIKAFTSGGFFYGFLGTVSTVLTGCSLRVLFRDNEKCHSIVVRPVAVLYALDATVQLAQMLFPAIGYNTSRTGVLTLCLQLPLGVFCWMPHTVDWLQRFIGTSGTIRWIMLALAASFHHMSLQLLPPPSAASFLLRLASLILAAFGLTPQSFWRVFHLMARLAQGVLAYVCSWVYVLVTYVMPKVIGWLKALLEHPCCVYFYKHLVLPLWMCLSPFFLPTCTAVIGFVCFRSLRIPTRNFDHAMLSVAQGYSVCAATLSTCILAANLILHIRPQSQPDPLQHQLVLKMLMYPSAMVAGPLRLLRWFVWSCWWRVVSPVLDILMSSLRRLGTFAVTHPLLSIPTVLLVNIQLVRFLSASSSFSTVLLSVEQWSGLSTSALVLLLERLAEIRHGAATDSTLAMGMITLVQVGAYATVDGVLSVLRTMPRLRPDGSMGDVSYEELNEVAMAMDDPRQCARCGFGPIDHQGCDNLRTHHGDVVAGGMIQNLCLRCGWFAGSLREWPHWDGELQTERGRALHRQRTWCEVVVTIKASSKALIVPYFMLLLGHSLQLSPTLSASLACSYLIPWTLENSQLFSSLASPVMPPHRAAPPRNRRNPRNRHPEDAPDCGARREVDLPDITQSQALQSILTSQPEAIFLNPGAICSVCLESFPDAAVEMVENGEGDVAAALQQLQPPIVALRCGHPLHLDCAEAAVSASRTRHLRCPLCRQPVTLMGEATANLFS